MKYLIKQNWSDEYIDQETNDDAIFVQFNGDGGNEAWDTIGPQQAREIAAALNYEADAFDEREKARQEASKPKLPKTLGSIIQLDAFGGKYVRAEGGWLNLGATRDTLILASDHFMAEYAFTVIYNAEGD